MRNIFKNLDDFVYAGARWTFSYHFSRMWPNRNSEEVFHFANGDVWDRKSRRESIRSNLRGQRSAGN